LVNAPDAILVRAMFARMVRYLPWSRFRSFWSNH